MTLEQIQELVAKLTVGQKINVVYKKQSAREVSYLMGMHQSNVINLDSATWALAFAIGTSGNWSSDRNRTMQLTVGENWDLTWFNGRVSPELEKIELLAA